jgi:hypothetical protein
VAASTATFEGKVRDVMALTLSDGTAPLKVKLHRAALRSQPQGPFDVAPGVASRDVPVRNVLATDVEYVFTVDHPAFSVGSARATIKANESANCSAEFADTGGDVSAKLLASDRRSRTCRRVSFTCAARHNTRRFLRVKQKKKHN